MRLPVNLDSNPTQITSDILVTDSVAQIYVKRGDTPSLDFIFYSQRAIQEIDALTAITSFKVGAKNANDYAGDYVVSNWDEDSESYAYTKTGAQRFSDAAITSSSLTLTSATAGFTLADIGVAIACAGIPAGTTIQGVVDETEVTLSQAATATATGVTIVVARQTTYSASPSFDSDALNDALINGIVSQVVADSTARYALTGKAAGYIVRQSDSYTYWILTDPANIGNSAGWAVAPELPSVDLMLEIEVKIGSQIFSTATVKLTVVNDVNKGSEGTPVSSNPDWPALFEQVANKDATGGYAGLTGLAINFWNAAKTFLSKFTNANTAARTYTFQDRDGTIADDTDIVSAKSRANHTGTQTLSTISDAGTAAAAALDADGTLAANSDSRVPTQKAVKTFVAANVTGLLDFKGDIDCSANPNYPAASKGDAYYVSVAGKIGGSAGKLVAVGDAIICKADNAGGDEASVGIDWFVLEKSNPGISDVTGLQSALDAKLAITWTTKSANYAAASGDRLLADTSGGAFTITLPASPSTGDCVEIGDAEGSFATNNLTVDRNGQSIDGNPGNLICDISGAQVMLVFAGGTKGWAVYGR